MDKRNVIEFFDRLAPGWDDDQVIEDRIIERILNSAHIGASDEVLDVACGTGVDISPATRTHPCRWGRLFLPALYQHST